MVGQQKLTLNDSVKITLENNIDIYNQFIQSKRDLAFFW